MKAWWLALVGVALVGAGVFWWKTNSGMETKVEIVSEKSESETIKVDVAGAVNKPGVYELAIDTRVLEALEAAGGLDDEADTEWVEMYLNRADKVKDGMKIYIPSKSEILNPKSQINTNTQISKININMASPAELEGLPGIGPVTAGKMVLGRPYSQAEELLTKKVVSQKVWEQIKELVSVW